MKPKNEDAAPRRHLCWSPSHIRPLMTQKKSRDLQNCRQLLRSTKRLSQRSSKHMSSRDQPYEPTGFQCTRHLSDTDTSTTASPSRNARRTWSCRTCIHSSVIYAPLCKERIMDFQKLICNNISMNFATDLTGDTDDLKCLIGCSALAWSRRNCRILR